jgi:hypothetical protein
MKEMLFLRGVPYGFEVGSGKLAMAELVVNTHNLQDLISGLQEEG